MSEGKDQPSVLRLAGPDGLALAATAFGPGDGALVVLLHGGGQSRTAWLGAARLLGGAGYRALSLDLRGHGQSDWSPDARYGFEDYAHDISAVLDQLGRRAVLVGASLGGRVALVAAAARPADVTALVLCDTAHVINEGAREEMRDFFHRSQAGFATLDEAAALLAQLNPDRPRGSVLGLRPHLALRDGRYHWRWDPRFADDEFIAPAGEADTLAEHAMRVASPTLLIRAEHSHVVTPAQMADFAALFPDAKVAEARGIGHMLAGDANDVYGPMILDFLATL